MHCLNCCIRRWLAKKDADTTIFTRARYKGEKEVQTKRKAQKSPQKKKKSEAMIDKDDLGR